MTAPRPIRSASRQHPRRRLRLGALLVALALPAGPLMADETTDAEEEAAWEAAWEEAEERQRLLEKARNVNEGELVFLETAPDPDGPRMEKRLELRRDSLEDGWARMSQCHYNLDAVTAAQVVYNPQRTREIQVTRADDIGKAVVDGPSVQLGDVGRDATLCVRAEVLAIVPAPEGDGYLVENGPFMRRFLDGYYPMQVLLEVRWPPGLLRLDRSEPPAQPGHDVETNVGSVTVSAHFEGRLRSRLYLERPDAP